MSKDLHVVFNAYRSGLGNNGGSKTIIQCSETLNKLGVKSEILALVDNFKWFGHEQTTSWLHHNTNRLINTSCMDLISTISLAIEKKYWYIRGHETWAMKELDLIKWYQNSNIKNIVNSKGMQRLLKSFGAESTVIYQGIPQNRWYDLKKRSNNGKIKIGCLYHRKPTKRWKDFVALSKILGNDKYEYYAFGNDSCSCEFLSKYIQQPTAQKLNALYNECHIWFLPTVLEGCHNVGMEASLCGCLLIGNNNPQNGMLYDYLFDNQTAMVYNDLDVEHAAGLIRSPDFRLIENAKKHVQINIGSVEHNMKKLIDLLKE